MERIRGDSHTTASEGTAGSRMHLSGGGNDPDAESPSGFRDRFGDVRNLLREGLSGVASSLEGRHGVLGFVRGKPLVALGVAFTAGFVVAASRPPAERSNWAVERTRRRLRTAILSGLTAILAEEAREILSGEESLGEFLRSFVSDEDDDLFEQL